MKHTAVNTILLMVLPNICVMLCPHASFIGFTGTPIESTDRNTQAVFGNYVDIYDIQQAVNDRATVQFFYESRLAKVHLKKKKVKLDERFEELTEGEELTIRQQLRAKWTRLEAIVGNPNRIKNSRRFSKPL